MLLFRSEEHISRWCKRCRQPRGATLTLPQTWQLAQAWYGPDRRDPAWRRYMADEGAAILAKIGLAGDFWRLS